MTAAVLVVRIAGSGAQTAPVSFADGVGDLDPGTVPQGWAAWIETAADEAGIPAPVLAAQLEVESGWRVDAVSPAGAEGPAQFTAEAWEDYGQGGDPHRPEHAIDAQGRYMGDLLDMAEESSIDGDPLELALAGYNAGFGVVERFEAVPPYPETQSYIASVRERTNAYELPA